MNMNVMSFLVGKSITSDLGEERSTQLGLIAGGGRLPILVARGLRSAGHPVHALGLSKQYEPELPTLCSSFREVGVLRVGTWGRILSGMGVRHAIMVG